MFIFEGPYTGAIIKFGVFVTHHYPLLSKPALKILSPTNISHPYINRMDNKVLFEWDPENDNFITLLQQFQNMFVQYEPVSEAERNQIASAVELSIKEISTPSNTLKKDIFTPCQLQWTDKLLELKSAYLNMGSSEQNQTSEVI